MDGTLGAATELHPVSRQRSVPVTIHTFDLDVHETCIACRSVLRCLWESSGMVISVPLSALEIPYKSVESSGVFRCDRIGTIRLGPHRQPKPWMSLACQTHPTWMSSKHQESIRGLREKQPTLAHGMSWCASQVQGYSRQGRRGDSQIPPSALPQISLQHLP